jgi:hypothetical protein
MRQAGHGHVPCSRARRTPRDLPAQGTVTQTDRLRAARTGQRAKDRGQTPPERTGTAQHDNQNVPRECSRLDRARKNLDRHPNYIFAAYMASGTLCPYRLGYSSGCI